MKSKRDLSAITRVEHDQFILDPVDARDGERLEALAEDPEFKRWLPWIRGGYNKERATEFAADFAAANWKSGQPVWALRIQNTLMGVIDLRDRGDDAWEIGFWMHPEARSKGLMTQACALVLQAAFDHLGAKRILHYARIGNVKSRRVARNLGFRPEGVRRKLTPSGIEKQWQSALLKVEWAKNEGWPRQSEPPVHVYDLSRPKELATETGRAESARTPFPEGLGQDVASREALALQMATLVYGAYTLAAEGGVDLDKALGRVHVRRLREQAQGYN